jgi:hypothetical protein
MAILSKGPQVDQRPPDRPVPPEVLANARTFGRAIDRCLAAEAADREDPDYQDQLSDGMMAAEGRFVESMKAAGLTALEVDGRLYMAPGASIAWQLDAAPSQAEVYDLADVARAEAAASAGEAPPAPEAAGYGVVPVGHVDRDDDEPAVGERPKWRFGPWRHSWGPKRPLVHQIFNFSVQHALDDSERNIGIEVVILDWDQQVDRDFPELLHTGWVSLNNGEYEGYMRIASW